MSSEPMRRFPFMSAFPWATDRTERRRYAELAMFAPIGAKYQSYIGVYSQLCVDNRGRDSRLCANRDLRHSRLCVTRASRSVDNLTKYSQLCATHASRSADNLTKYSQLCAAESAQLGYSNHRRDACNG